MIGTKHCGIIFQDHFQRRNITSGYNISAHLNKMKCNVETLSLLWINDILITPSLYWMRNGRQSSWGRWRTKCSEEQEDKLQAEHWMLLSFWQKKHWLASILVPIVVIGTHVLLFLKIGTQPKLLADVWEKDSQDFASTEEGSEAFIRGLTIACSSKLNNWTLWME